MANKDHPRVRGEKHLQCLEKYVRHWITPACAGKSLLSAEIS